MDSIEILSVLLFLLAGVMWYAVWSLKQHLNETDHVLRNESNALYDELCSLEQRLDKLERHKLLKPKRKYTRRKKSKKK